MHITVLSTDQPYISSSSAPNQGTEEHTGAYQPPQPLIAQRVFTVHTSLYTLIESLLDPQSFTYFSTVNTTSAKYDREVWAKRFHVYATKNERIRSLISAAKDERVRSILSSVPNPINPLPFKNLYFQFERLKFSNEENLLDRAINEGCTEVVSFLIARNPKTVKMSNSALEIAVKMKQLEIVRMLIQHSNPIAKEKALVRAMNAGDRDMIDMLLKNIEVIEDSMSLHLAINHKDIDVVKRLLDCKANIESHVHTMRLWHKNVFVKGPPLIHAIQDLSEDKTDYRMVGIVKILLEHKANLNPAGFPTALMCAGQTGNVTIMNLLLTHARKTIGIPAVINVTDSSNLSVGKTALMYAICSGCQEVVKLLISHKANINQIDRAGQTALIHGTIGNATTEGVQLLLDHHADVSIGDNTGKTAIWYAADMFRNGLWRLLQKATAKAAMESAASK